MKSQSFAPQSAIAVGIGLMLFAIFTFALNDAFGKWLVASYSISHVMLIRSVAGLLVLSPFIWRQGLSAYRTAPRPAIQIVRPFLSAFESCVFYLALAFMPLADIKAFYLAGPIYVTMLSPFLLGEHVGWRRRAAVAVGFVGVLIVLNPGSHAVSWPAMVAVVGSFSFALSMICTRSVAGTPDVVLMSAQLLAGLVVGLLLAPFMWTPVGAVDVALLSVLGIGSMIGHMCLNRALRLAPASVIVPYQYTGIIWASIFGFAFFGDVPTATMVIGAAIIIGAGLYIFLRERQVGAAPATATSAVVDPP